MGYLNTPAWVTMGDSIDPLTYFSRYTFPKMVIRFENAYLWMAFFALMWRVCSSSGDEFFPRKCVAKCVSARNLRSLVTMTTCDRVRTWRQSHPAQLTHRNTSGLSYPAPSCSTWYRTPSTRWQRASLMCWREVSV
jgi:hypothetical protein